MRDRARSRTPPFASDVLRAIAAYRMIDAGETVCVAPQNQLGVGNLSRRIVAVMENVDWTNIWKE